MSDTVSIKDMKRDEWIKYRWINIQTVQDENPVYIRAGLRPIEERKDAADQFDALNVGFMHIHANDS